MIGVVSIKEALQAAQEAGLDLVEVSPQAEPPVCKILDYGKFKYEQQKKKHEAKKKQKVIELKEIKIRPSIDTHDLDVKIKKIREFIAEGDKVKISIRFRGREMSHRDIGDRLMVHIQESVQDCAKAEAYPRMEGSQLTVTLVHV